MKRLFLGLLLSVNFSAHCLEKLHSDYLVTFGNSEAPTKIVEYFSFTCPHCLMLYKRDFAKIKEKYLDSEKVLWVFHPVPMDLLTVQAMDCLKKLSEREKRLFLEAILDVIPEDDSPTSVLFMQKAMELFQKPLPDLQEKDYLSKTQAFQDAFLFIKQEDKIAAVPTIEINGKLLLKEIPEMAFIDKKMQGITGASK